MFPQAAAYQQEANTCVSISRSNYADDKFNITQIRGSTIIQSYVVGSKLMHVVALGQPEKICLLPSNRW